MAQAIPSTQPVLQPIPEYLKPFIVDQDASLYTPIDHAGWRFILKISQKFFAQNAHQKYKDGLRETGISLERIPMIGEMNECLGRFGWRAVAVSGFIPTAVFMEFLSLGILPIACDMRKLEHLSYTPAPDIVHEAAGHAPILADPEYADYLRQYGELARRAIMSKEDIEIYYAVRHLSDVKEDPNATPQAIDEGERRLQRALGAVTHESETTFLTRMGWWTFEYGLVGALSYPKIYGAGLLSSVSESYHCLGSKVKKIPFSIDCIKYSYDITRPQPQLFVARDFQHLKDVLQELSARLAYRHGGAEGLEKAVKAAYTTTIVLETGLQISGTLASWRKDETSGQPIFLKFDGPTQMAFNDQEIENQGPSYHRDGFSTPMGIVRGLLKTAAELTPSEWETLGFIPGKVGRLEFESGIQLEGQLIQMIQKGGNVLLVTFQNCTVRLGEEILYRPEWGNFDLACGAKIVSVFGGAADRQRYLTATGGYHQPPREQKTNLEPGNRELNSLYARIRAIREAEPGNYTDELEKIHQLLQSHYKEDWLLRFELYELSTRFNQRLASEDALVEELGVIGRTSRDKQEMIRRGLETL